MVRVSAGTGAARKVRRSGRAARPTSPCAILLDVVSTSPPAPDFGTPLSPPRDGRKRLLVVALLLAVSAAMVWGTWAAIDDLRPKAMTAQITVSGDALSIVNTSGFAWTDAVFTINGTFHASAPQRTEHGAALAVRLDGFVDDRGQPFPAGDTVREVTAVATRHSALGRVNGARPTSGRFPLP